MRQKQLELLTLLRDLTRSGRVDWQRDQSDSYRADFAGLKCSLRFKYPLLAGDEGSDAEAIEVTAASTIWTFYIGTEGFDLALEILTAADPEMWEHNHQVEARLEETIEKIRRYAG